MLKQCIKVRVPTTEGWVDVCLEKEDGTNCYYPATEWDSDKTKESICLPIISHCRLPNAVRDGAGFMMEVTWQSDSWPA